MRRASASSASRPSATWTPLMRAVVTGGTGTPRQCRWRPRRRQDRHHQRLSRRLVLRLHRQLRRRGLVRQRRLPPDQHAHGRRPAGHDLAEIHGLCPHQYRDQTGARHRLQAGALRRRRRPTAGNARRPSGRRRSSPRRPTSCSISPTQLDAALRATGSRHRDRGARRDAAPGRKPLILAVPAQPAADAGRGAGRRLRPLLVRAHRRPARSAPRRSGRGRPGRAPARPRPIPTRAPISPGTALCSSGSGEGVQFVATTDSDGAAARSRLPLPHRRHDADRDLLDAGADRRRRARPSPGPMARRAFTAAGIARANDGSMQLYCQRDAGARSTGSRSPATGRSGWC